MTTGEIIRVGQRLVRRLRDTAPYVVAQQGCWCTTRRVTPTGGVRLTYDHDLRCEETRADLAVWAKIAKG